MAGVDIGTNAAGGCLVEIMKEVKKQARYCYAFSDFIEDLGEEHEELEAKRDDMQRQFEKDKASGKEPLRDSKLQLKKADELVKKVEELKKKAEAMKSCCPHGIRPNWICWYFIGRKAEKRTEAMELLNGKLRQNVLSAHRLSLRARPLSGDFIYFECTRKAHDEILKALGDDEKIRIGLCGMGGCGKTSLLKKVQKEMDDSKRYKTAFVVVSNPPNYIAIQDSIASWIGWKFETEMNVEDRAESLCMAFQGDMKYLIILDNVWQRLDFEVLGIPVGGNCKVLLSSRKLHIFDWMEFDAKIDLGILRKEEAWELFQKFSGKIQDSLLNGVAQAIADECYGLPVAIKAMAKALRCKEDHVWENALKKLKRPEERLNIDEEGLEDLYKCLKYSFDELKDPEEVSLFLLCALFPNDSEIAIEVLIRFAFGLGIFKDVNSYERARDKVPRTINKFKNNCLLLPEGAHVKLHDMFHALALRETKKKTQVIMGPKQIEDLAKEVHMKDTDRLYCHGIEKFPDQLNCPDLEILIVTNNGGCSSKFPHKFFIEMQLKVLAIENTCSGAKPDLVLPELMEGLKKLRALCLRGWTLIGISMFENLTMLDTLELFDCAMEELPKVNTVKLLEVSNCKLEGDPYKVLATCSHLKELYFVCNNFPEMGQLQIGDNVVKFFQLIGSFNALQRYHLGIGGSINTSKYHPSSKLISINDFDASSITNEAFQALSQTLEVLFLEKLKGDCNNIIPDLFPIQDECLKELKEFVIGNSDCIKCLIDTTSDQLHQTGTLFAKLQKLKVEAMKCLEALCHGPPPSDLFINLKELFIKNCILLESLCTTIIAQKMVMLEVLEVTDCDSLRCLIKVENEDEANSVGSALPRLKQISVKRCKTLKFLLPISFASGPLRLETLEIEDAAELQFVFGFDYNKKDKKQKLIDLSDVKIKLISLSKISNICPKNYIVKPPLDKPVVTGCPLLGDIFDIDSKVRQQEGVEANEQVDLQSLVSGEEQRFSIATARHALSLCQFNAFVAELIEEKDLLMSRLEGLGPHQMSKYGDEERNLIEEVKDLECIAEKSRSCCNGVFPNWLGRYNVGKRVELMTKRVKQFNKRFTVVSLPMIGQRNDAIVDMVGSRKGPRDEILAALEDDETNMIGLCGMGGCGKTHLIKQLCAEVHSLQLFDTIVFVVVTMEPNITRMQSQIAEYLDLRFELEQNDQERAIVLAKRLANGGKILIILDDMWEVLKLGDIGIRLSKNCKVVLTTRHRHLCTMMGCQRTVYLSVLSEEEAWNLFQQYADVEDKFKHLAQQIVKECRGLPLAIVTMAKTLRGRNVSVWKDTLMRLRNDEMTNASTDLSNVRDIIKLSIDHLEDDEAISLFYLCALFPEDSDIALEILIRFAFGLCIFKEVDSYETARIKVRAIIRKLIATNLLISEDENGNYLQMHDLVRDVSLDLSKKIQVSTGPRMNLQSLTERGYMEDTARLCCHDINEYPNQLNCPKLEFLFISNDGRFSSNFSDAFFFEMIELKVLTVINTSIVTTPHLLLPQSMETLEKLRTVCLRGWTFNNISILGKVGVIDTVELLFCVMMKLPEELADLKRLRLLEVSGCKIEGNPFEVLARCFYLEELYFVENSLPELASNDFGVVKFLHQISSLKALQRYHLEIGRSIDTMENDLITKFISINGFNIPASNEEIKNMARELEVIFLANVQGDCKNIFPDMIPIDEECMNKLTELLLQGSDNMEYLIDSTNHPINLATTVFSKLQKLKIRTMKCFKALCRGPSPSNLFVELEELFLVECCQLQCIVSMGQLNFCNLKQLQLEDCPKLTSVFTYSTSNTMILLEILKVQDCVSLRQIIKDEEEGEITPAGPIFPKLRKVYVRGCPHLEFIVPASFLGGLPQLSIISDLDTKVEVQQGGGMSKKQELELPEIQSSDMVVQSAEDILVEECKIERIFQLTESTIEIESNSLLLSCLQRLVLENLPNLRYIHEGYKQLLNLRRLKIYKCGELKSIFSLRLMAYIFALQELIIEDCSLLEQIIEHDYDDSQYIDTGPYHDNNNLQKITVKSCPKLGSLFTVSTAKTLKMIRTLKIEECPGMKFLLKDDSVESYKKKETVEEEDGQDIFPNLSFLSLKNLPELIHMCEGEMFETVQGVMFPESFNLYNLQSLTVESCRRLRSLFTVSTAVTLMWLTSLVIIDSPSLEYAIKGKIKGITVGKTKEMLPRLKILHLVKLPRLIIIHRAIKLQCEICHVHDCPMLEQTFADVVKPDDVLQERKEVDKETDGNQSVDSLLPTFDSGSSEVVSFHQGKQAPPSGLNTAEAAEAHSHARELEIVNAVEGLQERNSVNSMNSREVLIDKKPQIVTDPQQAHQEDKASLPLAGKSELLSPSRINTATASSTSEALDSSSKQQHQMRSSEIVKSLHKDPGPEESTLGSSSQIKVEKPSTVLSPSTRITTTPAAAEELTPSSLDQHPQKEELVDFRGLFKIKARQAGLLEEAFSKYSHLWEWKLSQKTLRICKVGYKSLADMLAFLKSETPKTMDDSKMEKFESLCYELKYFGFDKMWLTSIRQKVMDMQADHKNKLKQVDQLKSQIGALEEQLSDARASLTTANNDLSKPGHVFDF